MYGYDRSRIAELTRLIAMDLEVSPPGIDCNRVFNCIKNINADWTRQYADNPPFMFWELLMLLTTANSSLWFTKKQKGAFTAFLRAMVGTHLL